MLTTDTHESYVREMVRLLADCSHALGSEWCSHVYVLSKTEAHRGQYLDALARDNGHAEVSPELRSLDHADFKRILDEAHGRVRCATTPYHEREQSVNHTDGWASRVSAIEMPAAVFREALARIDEPLAYDGLAHAERHPAMRVLTSWWNANAPSLECRDAAFVSFGVRPFLHDPLVCLSELEVLGETDEYTTEARNARAHVGGFLVLEFWRSQLLTCVPSSTITTQMVGALSYMSSLSYEQWVGENLADEAWYHLRGLRVFSTAFPAAWNAITGEGLPAFGRHPYDIDLAAFRPR